MKRLLFLVIGLLLFKAILHCQTTKDSAIGLYKWINEVVMTRCDLNGTADTGPVKERSIPTMQFRVIDVINDEAIIRILDYTKGKISPKFYIYNIKSEQSYTNLSKEQKNARTYGSEQVYWKVPLSSLKANAKKIEQIGGSLSLGVLNFPFKYRVQKGAQDFSGNFNFGAAIGYTVSHKSTRNWTFNILSGYSISSINIDTASVGLNKDKVISVNNLSAFSLSLGGMFQFDRVQAGLFIGWDRISRLNQQLFDWEYQGKPWLSVAFGIAIFSGEPNKSDKKNEQ